MLTVQRLDWDSDFFGFGVGRLVGSIESAPALVQALAHAAASNIHLTYGQCHHDDGPLHRLCLAAGGRFVDAKRTYALVLAKSSPASVVSADIAAASGDDPVQRRQLRSLAWQSAAYSRFRVDPAMPANAWRRLYTAWIVNSLSGKFADAVLAYQADGRSVGMVTVSHGETKGVIGLLAVDPHWRGRGIARYLLDAARQRCLAAGCAALSVVTQSDNLPACSLYESAGYKLVDEHDIFHFWKQPP